jgi:L-aminopeptidase/D-esterase-like protein
MYNALTDIEGIKVGHYTDREAATGCTVVLCESGAVAGVDVRGAAPGTRETDLLHPVNVIEKVHALLLSGGSTFGLDAAGGVVRYLEEQGIGYRTSSATIPIVPAAILYDLNIGSADIRPGSDEGYKACLTAGQNEVAEGCVGAGTGATVGKLFGIERAVKSGVGTASQKMGEDVIVAALLAVNAIGDIIDPACGKLLAGPLNEEKTGFLSTIELLKQGYQEELGFPSNTTLGIIATNASLTKSQATKVAQMAQDGIARAINPCHTMHDGDTIFALSIGDRSCDVSCLGSIAAELVVTAIVRAVMKAETMAGVAAISDIDR